MAQMPRHWLFPYGAPMAHDGAETPSLTIRQERDYMPGEAVEMTRTWRVGKRRVTMTAPKLRNGHVSFAAMEWEPDVPTKLSKRQMKQYREGRDAAFAELCGELGIRGALGEI